MKMTNETPILKGFYWVKGTLCHLQIVYFNGDKTVRFFDGVEKNVNLVSLEWSERIEPK